MARLGSINIMLGLNTAKLMSGYTKATRATNKFVGRAEKSFNKLQKSLFNVRTAVGGVVAALGVNKFLETAGAFESMQVSLETVTGSAKNAEQAMAGIREFATETPFQVREITDSFIKLKALGLTPSEEAMRSYGNTSSAMGKSLNQMIEAVADATTGEFERLKEFGIKSKSEGDKVSFTFQGVTTKIGKNASEIENYLQSIGNKQFAGAMSKQMDTINGKMSNLSDSFDNLIVTYANLGGGNGGKGALDVMIDAVKWLTDGIKVLPSLFVVVFGEMDIIFNKWKARAKAIGIIMSNILSPTKMGASIYDLEQKTQAETKAIKANVLAYIEGEQKKQEAIKATMNVSGGGGDKGYKTTEGFDPITAMQEEAAKKFEVLDRSLMAENERLMLAHENRQFIVEDAFQAGLINEVRRKEILEGLELNHQAKLGNIEAQSMIAREQFRKKSALDKNKQVFGEIAQLTAGVASSNKTLFEINKIAGISNAVIDTYRGVTRTMAEYPYPLNIGMAALSLGAGLAQVNAIRSQSFGSGGGAPSIAGGGGGGSSTVNTIPFEQRTPQSNNEVASTQQDTLIIQGIVPDQIFTGQQMRDFAERLTESNTRGVSFV